MILYASLILFLRLRLYWGYHAILWAHYAEWIALLVWS